MRSATAVILVTLLVAGAPVIALDVEDTGAFAAVNDPVPAGRITLIQSPLPAVPAIVEASSLLRVEVAPAACALGCDDARADVAAALTPSFGAAAAQPLQLETVHPPGPSAVWPDGRLVWAYDFRAPDLDPGVTEILYDLEVRVGDVRDTQPRSVHVVDAFKTHPRVVVIADPQVGDPRAMQDGGEDAMDEGSPHPFLASGDETFFHFPGAWPAWQRTIEEVNLLRPDLVLIAGDITFGQDVPGKYYAEYETAWEVLQAFRVPTFLSLGNHDGYVQSGVDGFDLWQKYFGPLHYSADYGPDLHLVALNTYDWSELDRTGVAYGVSAWGGQVRDAQFDWLAEDLAAFRDRSQSGLVFTFGHHDPSWVQDDWLAAPHGPLAEWAEGVPVAEQVTRGGVSYTSTDQAWSGEGRDRLRDLLRAYDVTVHFSGHEHRDRVARDDGGHGIVGTPQHPELMDDPRQLVYVNTDDTFDTSLSQASLAAKLHDWSLGPAYVETTTAGSGTSSYWGYRVVDLVDDGAGGLDLAHFGYHPDQMWLDAHAREPSFWNASHGAHGLFSNPSYHLDLGPEEQPAAGTWSRTIVNGLNEDVDVVVWFDDLPAGDYEALEGAIVSTRSDGVVTSLLVAVTVPAGGSATATVTAA